MAAQDDTTRQEPDRDTAEVQEPAATGQRSSKQNDQPQESLELPSDALILIPTRGLVMFPEMILPIAIGRKMSKAAAQEAAGAELPVGLLLQKEADIKEPGPEDLYRVGTAADILRYITDEDGAHHLICRGTSRFRALEFLAGYPFHVARIEKISEPEERSTEIEARVHHLREQAMTALRLLPETPGEAVKAIQTMESPSTLADLVTGLMDIEPSQKQEILELIPLQPRLDRAIELLGRRIEVLRISHEINERTRETMDKRQREYLLREQLHTIQRELGEGDTRQTQVQEVQEAIENAGMPKEAEKQARKELRRLQGMPEAAAEFSMVRSYLDWLTGLPWSKVSEEAVEIDRARTILDEDHFDLDKVKRRILEHLAVHKLNPEGKSPILCFVGPPGVGKTSLGKSIARAMNREFVRQSLGGIHDEAEIRGHRRTYVGALPGSIIQSIRKAGTRNPVFMLDEVDKLGAGYHGDPSSALLEVLDPEQNDTFQDNYLAVPFDLSQVMFIATANVLDTIPGPLRDRMETIELPGYTEDEKVQIARRYLVARQREHNGLKEDQVQITDEALRMVTRHYTREAGCRNLEREIGSAFRWAAVRIAEGKAGRVKIEPDDLPTILGPRKFESELAMRLSVPGVATGLAWTPAGGDILFIEAARYAGKGNLILTGHLGDVMKESAQASLSLVKARASSLGCDSDAFSQSDIHIHVPAGATPKDGPSAGIAIFVALASLFKKQPIRSTLAMSGEISLRGLVLPVGGIKEKVVGGVQAGIKEIMLPERNRKDLEDIPKDARRQVKFHWIEHVDQALTCVLGIAVDGRTREERLPPAESRTAPKRVPASQR